jgi:hypothetical protein
MIKLDSQETVWVNILVDEIESLIQLAEMNLALALFSSACVNEYLFVTELLISARSRVLRAETSFFVQLYNGVIGATETEGIRVCGNGQLMEDG